jgi:hypothetical protein
MDSEPTSVNQLFKPERQYCVPLYQRAYVWNEENQWMRLWSDIQEKAEARLAGLPTTPHFMGAVVLDPQERKKLIGVEKVHIIDGQQRMTTLQFVLSALAIVLREGGNEGLLPAVDAVLRNSNEKNMRDVKAEPFKLWPTFYDRDNYLRTSQAQSLDELRTAFPDHFTQAKALKKIGVRHPPALAAIWFFVEQINRWIPSNRLTRQEVEEALAEAILEDLVVISITLGIDDDAQVIFETLNGHGVELTAVDLIRNFIFLRADAEGSTAEETAHLYSSMWGRFENDSWKTAERRGRLTRPRLEWFIQTVLQSETRDEVDQGRIYAEYQRYIKRNNLTSIKQLETLGDFADFYVAMLDADDSSPIGRFGKRFREWDASTTYVLALAIAKSGQSYAAQDEMFGMLGSYLVRRAICDLTNKNYNKVFLQILRNLRESPVTSDSIRAALESLGGEARRWPRDDEFKKAFLTLPMYPGNLDAPKMRSVMYALENMLRTERSEEPYVSSLGNLDIDHMLPQAWSEHWPLPDGTRALPDETQMARVGLEPPGGWPPRLGMIRDRETLVPTIGNLTLLHYGTNRSAGNLSFAAKQQLFLEHSNLHLNRQMLTAKEWSESSIKLRSEALFSLAVKIWPGPIDGK